MMSNQDMKIRGGTVDYGRLYEQRIAAHLAIKSALDPDVSDFWIVSNIDGFDAFDDIVLMVQDRARNKKLYCLQLKHLENKSLQGVNLESKSSKINLKKYQDSFDVIEKNIFKGNAILKDFSIDEIFLILWTNAPFTGTDKMQTLKSENVGGMDFLNTSTGSNVYKLSNLPTGQAAFNENFLERFYLFANQAAATAVDKIIKTELTSHLNDVNNSVIIALTDYFVKWSLGDSRTIRRISKSDVQRMLLEFLILPYVIEPSFTEQIYPEKLDILNDTLIHFNVIPITETGNLKNVFNSSKFILDKLWDYRLKLQFPWTIDLSSTQWDTLKLSRDEYNLKIRKILQDKKLFVPHLTTRDLYLAAWECRLIPLVLNCTVSPNFVENVLVKFEDVTKDLSFILIKPVKSALNETLKIFSNINDISDVELKARNLDTTYVSLQGKEKIKLEKFKEKTELLEGVTPDVYLILMETVIDFGETIEVESYYIQRDLRRPLLKPSVLDENSALKDRQFMLNTAGDLFILVEFDGYLPLTYQSRSSELSKYLREKTYVEDEKVYILHTHLKDTDQDLAMVAVHLHTETTKSVHVVKLKDGNLEWSYSKGTVETLQQHLIESNLLKDENPEQNIPESSILNSSRSSVNIISNNAGMGKTFMLKSIANKFEPDEWVCYVNLSEHISKIPEENKFQSFFNYLTQAILQMAKPCLRNFCAQMYINCLQTGKMICLFDGYDEVSSDHILAFLKEAKARGLRMWITTRPTYKRVLEMHMENLSVEITHFNTEDHVTFLWKYFHSYHNIYHYNDTQIQYIINTINKCSRNLDKTLICLPLQTRMFAEIFGDDISQIDEKEKLTIVDLYNKFVDVKLKEYKSYEATSLKKTLSKLALKLFFTETVLEDLLDFHDLAEEAVTFQESYKKDSIVIGLNEKGDAVFGHRTFAEFLAAFWIAKQIVDRKGGYNLSWVPLVEKLYYIEMVPVRVFFDRILSQNLPLHIAVLSNDKENIRTLMKTAQFKELQDVLGRSPLHLAVTYGTYRDLYIAREIKGLRNVGLHSTVRTNPNGYQLRVPLLEEKQYRISNEIVEELLKKGFTNIPDKLLGYDLFDYAMKSCCLNSVDTLYKHFQKVTLHFEIGFSFEIFLYCIVHDNLHNILSKRKFYTFDATENKSNELRDIFKGYNFKLLTMKYNDMYLTEEAALTGAKEIIFDLVQSGAVKIEDGNPVHKACFGGHSEVVELLYKMGADIDKLDDSNLSPLYQAGKRGRSDIVYHLLKSTKFMSVKSPSTNMTPLHYAAQGGYSECVKKLIENGAKVNIKDAYGNTPLLYACQYGHSDTAELLLKSGLVDISDKMVKSSLNVAAFHGYSDCVRTLLEFGIDVNNIDDDGNSPLVIAGKSGFSNVVVELASCKNCDLNMMVYSESLNSLQMWCAGNSHILLHTKLFMIKSVRNKKLGITALHFAVRHGHVDCTKTLIELGADKHIEDEVTRYSSLVWAVMYGWDKVLKLLLKDKDLKTRNESELGLLWACMLGYEKCVDALCEYIEDYTLDVEVNEEHNQRVKALITAEFAMDMMFIRENENMPLLLAARNGSSDVIKVLLSRNYRNNYGLEEALYWAAKSGHLECVKMLILAGADENKKNEKSLRLLPICWASMYGRTIVVEYLLSNKTCEYLKNSDLQLALTWAAVGGHYECLKLLLDFGLDVDTWYEDLNGTPLICACDQRGTVEVVQALIERNCKINVTNSDGFTALDFAARKKNFPIVKVLVLSGAFKDLKVDSNSDLYKNLQSALEWAVKEQEAKLIEELIQIGISVM